MLKLQKQDKKSNNIIKIKLEALSEKPSEPNGTDGPNT